MEPARTDALRRPRVARRTRPFTESVIREMTRIAQREGAINLAQGFPDFDPPRELLEAAKRAIDGGFNQYAVTWGAPSLRRAIARRAARCNGIAADPDLHVTVVCGATEGMVAAMLSVLDPEDEVVLFEPFYENYGPDCILAGAVPRYCRLRPPDWTFDPDELAALFGPRTRAIVVNTPHNPTGKVFSREELETIAGLCIEHDALALTDEIYDAILYDGANHVSMASLPGMEERTVTINGLSKTFSATGWRIGWCIASEEITAALRKVHDFLTVGAAAPLQEAAAEALDFGTDYERDLRRDYTARRDLLVGALRETGFEFSNPRGAYYVMARAGAWLGPGEDDRDLAHRLVRDGGVACVPGSSFYRAGAGQDEVRFCFAKELATLEAAGRILRERAG